MLVSQRQLTVRMLKTRVVMRGVLETGRLGYDDDENFVRFRHEKEMRCLANNKHEPNACTRHHLCYTNDEW